MFDNFIINNPFKIGGIVLKQSLPNVDEYNKGGIKILTHNGYSVQYGINKYYEIMIGDFEFKKEYKCRSKEEVIESEIDFYTEAIELLNEYDKKRKV